MKIQLKRRTFLRGLGGVAVAAPFLSSIAERDAKGQTAKPKNFIAMFTHYGCITTKFFPAKAHGALAASDLMATNLAALAPYVSKVLVPRGIRGMNEWTQNNRGSGSSAAGRGQANDPHLNVAASYFTLQPVTPSGTDPFSFDMAYKFNAVPIGSSLDHVMAQQLSPQGTPLFMRVGNRNDGAQSGISYLKDATAAANAAAKGYPGLGQPSQVFSALMGLFDKGSTGGGGMTPATYAMSRGAKICDLVKDDLATLKRQPMSASDANTLDVWATLCNDMGTIVTSNLCTTSLANGIGGNSTNANKTASNITSMVTTDLDGADIYSVMAVLSAMCNYNPVIFLKYPPNYVYSGIGITADSHNLSHRLDNAGMTGDCYPNSLTLLQTIDKYYCSKFAKLVGMLDGIKQADGSTLLDSSAAVWVNEMSDGNAHNLNNLPIIHAGGLNGYFKTGWAVNLDTASPGAATLSNGNSESQCANGTGTVNGLNQSTGTDAKIANAPINKYYYNIMNAMGVKGDATTGFPTKGGTAPVSKFGYSDKTEDFAGGYMAKPDAAIHSPGEYTALKAGS
jgi:hypothetical protein